MGLPSYIFFVFRFKACRSLKSQVFSADVPAAYRNVYIELDRLLDSSGASSSLLSETDYQAPCVASKEPVVLKPNSVEVSTIDG